MQNYAVLLPAMPSVLHNREIATWCFIISMITMSLQALIFVRKFPKPVKLAVEIANGISWLATAVICIALLYDGWGAQLLGTTYIIMYTVRIFASFIISAASFDLAAHSAIKHT